MNYCKITSTKQAQMMPNPFHLTIANPNETQKATLSGLDNWLPMVYTEQPAYDPETQYLTETWEEENRQAVQHWTINEKPPEDPTLEERVDSLEQNVSDIVNGVVE